MKLFFTLITMLFATVIAVAQWGPNNNNRNWNQTRFSVTSLTNRPIRVMIDGQWIQDQNNDIRISYLNPGMHRVQIYAMNRNSRDREDRGWGWGRGNNRNGDLIYNVNLNLRQGMHMDILINRFGRVFVDEQAIDNRWDDDRNNGGGWNNGRRDQAMDNNSFQQFKQMIEREGFDDNKLNMIRSALPNNFVSSAQVREMMQQMSFEQNKLELAKFAYRYTTDRNNYFVVNDVFSFGNSKTELSNYIMNYRD